MQLAKRILKNRMLEEREAVTGGGSSQAEGIIPLDESVHQRSVLP
jgi:hypothetical protein